MFLGFDGVDPSSILPVLIGIDELEAVEGSNVFRDRAQEPIFSFLIGFRIEVLS